jgi:hypothetical protein
MVKRICLFLFICFFVITGIYPENNIDKINFRIQNEYGIEEIVFDGIYINEIVKKISDQKGDYSGDDRLSLIFKFTTEGKIKFSELSRKYLHKTLYIYILMIYLLFQV